MERYSLKMDQRNQYHQNVHMEIYKEPAFLVREEDKLANTPEE